MNENLSESRFASTEAFQESLDVLGDLLDPLEDEEVPIPRQPDSQPDRVWDEVGDDLEALLRSEDNEEGRKRYAKRRKPKP
ncbi:MAG: hypothetical protein J7647_02220 [Cyanobacteria bacterium SBLK]|nr:hypothetical protein [Cyanobacteria bacterium SBLK]